MEFFDWVNIVQVFAEYFTTAATPEAYIEALLRTLYISLGVAGGVYLICLVLGGLGMRKMAQRAGMKHTFLAFLPFANTYYAGKLAGDAQVFGTKMKRAGLYAMLTEIVYVGISLFYTVIQIFLYRPEYFEVMEDGSTLYLNTNNVPLALRWMVTADLVLSWVNTVCYLALLFFFCVLFIAFFRKYFARGVFWMTLLSTIVPLRGVAIFAVRNNTPVDYDAYMRRRMEEYARRQQGYGQGGYGGYGGGYGGYDADGNRTNAPQDDPFSDFGGSPAQNGGQGGSSGEGSGGSGGSNGSDGNNDPFPDF